MKTYVVVGLGRFGQSIARRLCELGNEVLAMDKNPEYVQQISNFVTQAVVADAQDPDVQGSVRQCAGDVELQGDGDPSGALQSPR